MLHSQAAPATLHKILLTHRIARKMKLPEPRVTDATRARIEAQGSPGHSTGPNPAENPALSTSAAGPIGSSSKHAGRALANQREGGSMQEKQGQCHDAGRHSGHVSSGKWSAGAAGPEVVSSNKGEDGAVQGGSFPRSKAVSTSPASCAEQGGSGLGEGASGSMGEAAAECGGAKGGEGDGPATTEPKVGGAGGGAGQAKKRPERMCANCGVTGKCRVCSRCREAFCSEACQRAAWPSHKLVCVPK